MSQKKTILVVDDDPDFLLQQQVQLEAAGYEVIPAPGRAEAEALLAERRPDIAVIDLMMEDQDAGFALAYHIKKREEAIPVVIVSGVANETGLAFDAATQEERSWIKADAFLAKPVRFEQLTREIERLTGEG
ncbi:MAG: response regulator transcription factor [Planctomycetota bacterium]